MTRVIPSHLVKDTHVSGEHVWIHVVLSIFLLVGMIGLVIVMIYR